jgi:1,5-anhydro-D-fructose reductase (1,5-anhydro-D-mannitol-forming)
MIKAGIAGFGFMGKMHFNCYQSLDDFKVIAICDIDKTKLNPEPDKVGNINYEQEKLDFNGLALYQDFDTMIKECELDVISITLPTHLHCQYSIKALEAGINVMCEKPMALDLKSCDNMITAAEKNGKILQIGHCIRFWPEYSETKKIIDSGTYGRVKAAYFERLSMTPVWSSNNWMLSEDKSGGAIVDLHIHDIDYIHYVFGTPKAVYARAVKGPSAGLDHVVANYIYDDDKVISAEGGWMMKQGFGFKMAFKIILEEATVIYDMSQKPSLIIYTSDNQTIVPEIGSSNGYLMELEHFANSVINNTTDGIASPDESRKSVYIALQEKKSFQTATAVML